MVGTSNVTVAAFNEINEKQKNDKNITYTGEAKSLGIKPNKIKVKVVTNQDDKTHTYFHSVSIDAQVTDFMHTAELKCPFDQDLLEYWEIIRQSCVIYGANSGDYKVLFIGRVREVLQDGYELVISLQNFAWKLKQDVSQSYANDNVLNKNGYQIMTLMFEALKIDSYIISKSAKNRLKQVGINSDGNLTVNGEEVEEIPDLIERLKESDPSKLVSKKTLTDKMKESEVHNIENINYTLKYEEKTPVMQQLDSEGGSYSSGSNVYGQSWGSGGGSSSSSSSSSSSGNSASSGSAKSQCNGITTWPCSIVKSTTINKAMISIVKFNLGCTNDYSWAKTTLINYAKTHANQYNKQAKPCLQTIAKNVKRSDKRNAAQNVLNNASPYASVLGQGATTLIRGGTNYVKNNVSMLESAYNGLRALVGW